MKHVAVLGTVLLVVLGLALLGDAVMPVVLLIATATLGPAVVLILMWERNRGLIYYRGWPEDEDSEAPVPVLVPAAGPGDRSEEDAA